MVLTNQINEAEKMYICMLNPMHNRTPAVGLLSGIGSTPFFAPIALKTLISKEPLEENDRLLTSIKLDKDDYHLLRYYNMLVVNRPASLFCSNIVSKKDGPRGPSFLRRLSRLVPGLSRFVHMFFICIAGTGVVYYIGICIFWCSAPRIAERNQKLWD